jgi:hypothetical protein
MTPEQFHEQLFEMLEKHMKSEVDRSREEGKGLIRRDGGPTMRLVYLVTHIEKMAKETYGQRR